MRPLRNIKEQMDRAHTVDNNDSDEDLFQQQVIDDGMSDIMRQQEEFDDGMSDIIFVELENLKTPPHVHDNRRARISPPAYMHGTAKSRGRTRACAGGHA
jgi:hypothetical protein